MNYVLDASVAAKWFLPWAGEPYSEAAVTILQAYLLRQASLSVPDLFWPAVGNILWKAVRRGRMAAEDAVKALAMADEFDFVAIPSKSLWKQAFAIARQLDRTVYDGLYLAMASETRTALLTADERLVRAAGGRYPVVWIGAIGFVME